MGINLGKVIISICCFCPLLLAAKDHQSIKISIVHSYHKNYPITAAQELSFSNKLSQLLTEGNIKYSTIYLDTKWIEPSLEYRRKFLQYWKFKNKQYQPDYIYVTDDNALNFLLQSDGTAPFPIPMIYSGINDLQIDQRINKKSVIGITQKKNISKTLELAKKLNVNYKSIVFVGDGGVTDIALEKEIYNKISLFPQLKIQKISSVSQRDITAQIKSIKPDLIIITTLGKVKNNNNRLLSIDEITQYITSLNIPVLAMDSAFFQNGVLGGVINSNKHQGSAAAQIMARLIEGTAIHNIQIPEEVTEVTLDYVAAKHFEVNLEDEYFSQVNIINKPQVFYSKPNFITHSLQFSVIILSVFLLLTMVSHLRNRSIMKSRLIDKLSGLKNRTALYEYIESKGKNRAHNLAMIDILDFRSINDFYGLDVGDAVIHKIAKAMVELATGCDIYRISGDVFAVKCSSNAKPDDFYSKVQQLIKSLENITLEINSHEINLKFVAGICLKEKDKVITKADLALQKVKETFDDIYVYDKTLENSLDREVNLAIARTLKAALKNNQLVPFLQPIVCNKSKQIVKYEALARIVTDDRIISPFEFLPVAKITKQYIKLTEAILTKTIESIIKYDISISVNFSIEDICSDTIIAHFKSLIKNRDIANKIGIEIVESERIESNSKVESFISEFKTLGCHVLIDDFGTGYSNFTHILTINADIIKIDGSIIRGILHDENSIIIVKTIVGLAKSLKMKTIAEFVESKEIFEKVAELGIDYSQGYYFGKPESLQTLFGDD